MNKKQIRSDCGCYKNFDEIKKNIAGRIPEATRSVKTSQKTVLAAEIITFCIKPLSPREQNAAKIYIIENVR